MQYLKYWECVSSAWLHLWQSAFYESGLEKISAH